MRYYVLSVIVVFFNISFIVVVERFGFIK